MKKSALTIMSRLAAPLWACLALALSATAVAGSAGDLDIYAPADDHDKNPTLLLMLEGSTFTNNADSIKEHWADVEIIGLPESSNTNPSYQRFGYFNSISGTNFPTRLTRMKDAIFYLMDTPGLLPDSYRIGLGRYSGGTTAMDNPKMSGDSTTGSIVVPSQALGPIPKDKGRYLTKDDGSPLLDADGNKIESHRWKVKNYVAQMCEANKLCTGEAPMAAAYAEAGAYMMGTKTSVLTQSNDVDNSGLAWPRPLRRNKSTGQWQYCYPENRRIVGYLMDGAKVFREECPDSITKADGTTINPWIDISKDSIPPTNWAGLDDNPTQAELDNMQAKYKHYQTDLLWYFSNPFGSNAGTSYGWDDLSPATLVDKKYKFSKDDFQNRNPTKDADGNPTSAGVTDNYDYYKDDTAVPDSGLYPTLRYRAFRVKGIGSSNQWQFCDEDKAQLVNYISSSYRLMCKEGDWVNINKDNASNFSVDGKPIEWNCGLLNCGGLVNRPHGISGWHPLINPRHYYLYDPVLSPSDGWRYYYNVYFESNIKLPPTLNFNYGVSGIRNSPPEVRNNKSYTYEKPTYSECSSTLQYDDAGNPVTGEQSVSNAIIFITAGWPRNAQLDKGPLNEMNMSLSPSEATTISPVGGVGLTGSSCDASGLDSSSRVLQNPINNHWGCMGEYARRLNSTNNPAQVPVKTGVFMFTSNNERMTATGSQDGVSMYDCATAPTISQKNACLLGQYGAGYGEGGFFQSMSDDPEASYKELAESIQKMADNLVDSIDVAPSDMPAVPQNPFNKNALLKVGFLPLVAPDLNTTNALWQGNVRKYKLGTSGFYDKQTPEQNPFAMDVSAPEKILSDTTLDFWSALSVYTSASQAGGAYERLPYPLAGAITPLRNVYVQTGDTALTKLNPTATGMSAVSVSTVVAGNQDDLRRRLLNFLGFNIGSFISNSTDVTKPNTTDAQIKATADGGASSRLHGGMLHSKPFFISYKGAIENDGSIKSVSNQVVYGAMDGALHVVDEATGEESLAFIPADAIGGDKYKALSGGTVSQGPVMGVDAPWVSDTKYSYDFSKKEVTASQVRVYGGLRLGGTSYYGLDLTDLTSPSLLFSISPKTSGFERMAHTWAEPVVTQIKWGGVRKKVLIVPAGYDRTFDKTAADLGTLTETKGNAVYFIDAATGDKLITLAKDTSQCNKGSNGICGVNANMKYSIVGAVKALDRDADDLTDHIYFTDLGGQVFRADISNNRTQTDASVKRVVRIANLGSDVRLFETPVVTIHKAGGARFAVVSVASGDRSNPSFKNSDASGSFAGYTNQVYAIFDKDVARQDIFRDVFEEDNLHTKDISTSNMTNEPSVAKVGNLLSTVSGSRLDGWYVPLNRFAGDASAKHLKAMGPLSAIANDLYVSVYNYYDSNTSTLVCTAGLRGKTEANQFCLPYGFCKDSSGNITTVNRQRFAIGKGIMSVTYGATDAAGLERRIITQSGGGSGSSTLVALEADGPAVTDGYTFNYILQPTRWFVMNTQKEAKVGVTP